jgi:hypothetical protein
MLTDQKQFGLTPEQVAFYRDTSSASRYLRTL